MFYKNSMDMSAESDIVQFVPPSTRSRLEQKKQFLELELKKVVTAIAALDQNPDLETFMEVIKAAQV